MSPDNERRLIQCWEGLSGDCVASPWALGDRNITVNEARPKAERAGGGFRGGRDRGERAGYGRRY